MANHTQRVIWTALPTGCDGKVLHLTALASLRLGHDGPGIEPLKAWPDMLDWATRVRGARFTVRFAGQAARATPVSAPDAAVWAALFPGDTPVRGHGFEDRRGTRILSYPVARVHDFVAEVYGALGLASDDELPDKRDVLRPLLPLARGAGGKNLQAEVLAQLGSTARQAFAGVAGAFALQEVYTMPLASIDPVAGSYLKKGPDDPRENAKWRQHRFTALPKASELAELVDFHARLSALNQYPRLLRLAGLAIDLEVRASALPAGPLTEALTVEVAWASTPQAESGVHTHEDGRPRTITYRDDPRFEAVPKSPSFPIANGFLVLDERFRLLQMDVDGAGIKLRNTAISYLRSTQTSAEKTDPGGVPTLRTAGLQLVETDRHLRLNQAFERSGEMNDALEGGAPVELFAEDLVRGYHVDVLDHSRSAPWRSLCRRDGRYELLNAGTSLAVEDEEGMVRLGAQEAADETDPAFQKLVKIGETVFAWSGWSLSAPRPGLAVGIDDTPEASENTAPPGLPLESAFTVRPGSLPALRFGHDYRVRVRLADLAGNARRLRDGDTDMHPEASAPHTYRRFEPVLPPAPALVDGPGGLERPHDGESMARLAIRSFNETEADNTVATSASARRHLVPPRTSHVMAEQHGMLDDGAGRPDPALYAMLALRDANLAEVQVLHEDPLTASSDLVGYSAGPEDLATPYLPDPLALAAVLRFDGDPKQAPTERVEVHYYGAAPWPDALPFRLRIFEGVGSPTFDASTRTVNVPLPKAEVLRVRVSHLLKSIHLDQMAIWEMMRRHVTANAPLLAQLRTHAERGEHWMLTPWVELELVHAVQRPLVRPALLSISATRALGDTTAQVRYTSPVHAKSTDKLELTGRWVEPSDVPAEGAPRVLNQSGPAFEERLSRGSAPGGTISTHGPHAFGDTRYRRVAYRLEAPTRFREFMPSAIRSDPARTRVVSEEQVALVPNAAVPPAPEIVELVPTFGWTRSKTTNGMSSFRSGGGLRVWLRRPWYTSGFGEMLGVLVARPGATRQQITGPLAKFVTQWGADPIWRSGSIAAASPPLTAFPNRITGGPIPAGRSPAFVPDEERGLPNPLPILANLPLPESGGARVDVAAHPVQFDAERDLYYCDVQVRPGSAYYPFVRLALSRFHPVSAPGAHLSPAVIGDYMQLAPDRLLRLTRGAANRIKLELYGHSYTRSPFKQEFPRLDDRPVIRYELQRRDPNLSGDVAWQRVDPSPGPLVFEPILVARTAPVLRMMANEFTAAPIAEFARISLDLFVQLTPPLMWETTVQLPRIPAGEDWRVMVFEYERHSIDRDRPPRPADAADPSLRLVYAEALPL
jgi:hypothetical protein